MQLLGILGSFFVGEKDLDNWRLLVGLKVGSVFSYCVHRDRLFAAYLSNIPHFVVRLTTFI